MPNLTHRRPHPLIGLIIILPPLLFWRWIIYGQVIFWGTPLFQFWPWHHLTRRFILDGHWPLWNPLLGNGTPLLANLQSAVFYPPNLIYLLMPVAQALTFSVVLHMMLAGLLMYGYGREIKLTPFGATLSALSYMLSGYLVGRTQFVVMINVLAWLPLLLLLSERLVARREIRRLTALGLGVTLAIQFLAGHAQLWFYGLWLIGGYTIFRAWQLSRSPAHIGRVGLWLGGSVGLALLLTAAQLLPTAEFTLESGRTDGAERSFALTYSYWPWRLITLLAPNFFGHPAQGDYWGYANYWEDHAYVGLLPLLLALLAIGQFFWGRRRCAEPVVGSRRVIPFFAILIPISLILALGWNTPIYLWVFDVLPGFGYFQAPSRLLIWYTVAISILAGIGGDTIELSMRGRRWAKRFLVASLGIALAGLGGSLLLTGVRLSFLTAATEAGILLALAIGLLLIRPTPFKGLMSQARRWQWLAVLFVAVDLGRGASALIPLTSPRVFQQSIATADVIKAQPGNYRFYVDEEFDYTTKFNRFFRFDQFGPEAVEHWQQLKETLAPNFGVYADLPSVNNDDPLTVGRWQSLIDAVNAATPDQQRRLLGLMNVGYLLTGSDPVRQSSIYEQDETVIQRIPAPLPRAYFVAAASVVKDEAAALARLKAADFDSRREVVIISEGLPGESGGNSVPIIDNDIFSSKVTVSQDGPNQVRLSLEVPAAGFVVLTDTFYPGWQAALDGQPAPIFQANLAFRAVAVEAGAHDIVFTYRPRSFTVGLWISGFTWLAVVVTAIIHKIRE